MAATKYFIPGNTSQSLTEKNDQVDLLCSVLKFLSIDFKRKKYPTNLVSTKYTVLIRSDQV